MKGFRRKHREAAAGIALEVAKAMGTHECTACGRRFEGVTAFQLHRDFGRCLSDMLLEANHLTRLRDGRWARR